jgi:type IV pilus assembly protein PilA
MRCDSGYLEKGLELAKDLLDSILGRLAFWWQGDMKLTMMGIYQPRAAYRLGSAEAGERGLTLVEVAIVVGVIAIIATLATQQVRSHLAVARSAEAIQSVGAIGRSVMTSYATRAGDKPASGASELCQNASAVPSSFNAVRRRKYQPGNSPGHDYETAGWKCIRYANDMPQYYQYRYKRGGPPLSSGLPPINVPGVSNSQEWTAYARGDVDGDGVASWFALSGYVLGDDVTIGTAIAIVRQEE